MSTEGKVNGNRRAFGVGIWTRGMRQQPFGMEAMFCIGIWVAVMNQSPDTMPLRPVLTVLSGLSCPQPPSLAP